MTPRKKRAAPPEFLPERAQVRRAGVHVDGQAVDLPEPTSVAETTPTTPDEVSD